MQKQTVIIKSSKNGINLVLDETMPFDLLLEEVKNKFVDSEKFFKNARIAISFEGRSLSEAEQYAVIDVIQQNTTISVVCIMEHDDLMDEVIKRRMDAYVETHSPQTGQFSGIEKVPFASFTAIHFGMILFALMTSNVHSSPIPSRSISLILQREARLTVVPSSCTGSKTATGEIVDAAQDHST